MIEQTLSQTKKTSVENLTNDQTSPTVLSTPKGTFWSRHSAIINFWLDVILLVLFLVQAWMFAVLHVVFPRGADAKYRIWGLTPLDWSESLFATFCIFAVAIVLHVMFHWAWICGIVATRILHQKARKDDGSHTLIGVGLGVLLIHLLVIGILAAKVSMTHSN